MSEEKIVMDNEELDNVNGGYALAKIRGTNDNPKCFYCLTPLRYRWTSDDIHMYNFICPGCGAEYLKSYPYMKMVETPTGGAYWVETGEEKWLMRDAVSMEYNKRLFGDVTIE